MHPERLDVDRGGDTASKLFYSISRKFAGFVFFNVKQHFYLRLMKVAAFLSANK